MIRNVQTQACISCHKTSTVQMTASQYLRYRGGVENLQDIFPDATADFRELLITGTHKECWDKMFGEGDEDNDL